jgi:hypothetical protein
MSRRVAGASATHRVADAMIKTHTAPVRKETTRPHGFMAKVATCFQLFFTFQSIRCRFLRVREAAENDACNTLAFTMTRFLCVLHLDHVEVSC